MAIVFTGEGNLGHSPSLTAVPTNDGPKSKIEVSVHFERRVYDEATQDYVDRGSFWATVEMWGANAEHAARALAKGDRVIVMGSFAMDQFELTKGDRAGQIEKKPIIRASAIGICPVCIDYVNRRSRSKQGEHQQAASNQAPAQPQPDQHEYQQAEHQQVQQQQQAAPAPAAAGYPAPAPAVPDESHQAAPGSQSYPAPTNN